MAMEAALTCFKQFLNKQQSSLNEKPVEEALKVNHRQAKCPTNVDDGVDATVNNRRLPNI